MTECKLPSGGEFHYTETRELRFECGGTVDARFVTLRQAHTAHHQFRVCEVEVTADKTPPRSYYDVVHTRAAVASINGKKCSGSKPCVRVPFDGGMQVP